MSNEEHRDEDLTAREWTVTDTASNYRFNVVRIGTHDVVFPDEDTARLAAAAPRLLAALRWAREALVGEYNEDGFDFSSIDAAIAGATRKDAAD